MSIIQIRTTNTCSGTPKWLEKTYMFPWGACLGPMPGMGMNYNHTGVLAHPQTFRNSVLNPHKSKNHQKVIKGGMVSHHGTYMSW